MTFYDETRNSLSLVLFISMQTVNGSVQTVHRKNKENKKRKKLN